MLTGWGCRIVRHWTMALLVSAGCLGGAMAADPLGRFPIDPAEVSVSGISSGAFMANQLHIAHSAGSVGAGVIDGGLLGCEGDRRASDGGVALASLAVWAWMALAR